MKMFKYLGLFLTLAGSLNAATEYDIVKTVDLTRTNYVTASLLNQLIDTATISATNKGVVLRRSGEGGSYWPDVANNTRYTNFIWLDTYTAPATLKQYICCGNVYTNWVASVVTPSSVTTTEILDYSITAADMATNSVPGYAIQAGAVSDNKIADNGILAGKLASAAVILGNYAFGSIRGGDITNNTITVTNLADGAVTRDKILSGAIGSMQLSNNVIQNSHLSNGIVYGTNIAYNTIQATNIVNNSITQGQLSTNIFYGIPFAWATIENGVVKKGYNISSATAAGTGKWFVNFINPAPNTNYAVNISVRATAVTYQTGYYSNELNSVVIASDDSTGAPVASAAYSIVIYTFQ